MFISSVGAVHGPAITEELQGDVIFWGEWFVVVISKEGGGGCNLQFDNFWPPLQHCDQQPG